MRCIILCLLLIAVQAAGQPISGSAVYSSAMQVYREQGPKAALPEFERAWAQFQKEGDRAGEAQALSAIGNCYRRFGDFKQAIQFHQRALAIRRQLRLPSGEARSHSNLGLIYEAMADYKNALTSYERGLILARRAGERTIEAAILNNMAMVFDARGDYGRSLAMYEQVLRVFQESGDTKAQSDALGNIGGVHLLLGRFAEALKYYEQSYTITGRLKLVAEMSVDLGNIGLCHTGLGNIDAALKAFDQAIALAQEAGTVKEEANWRKGKGSALMLRGRYSEALQEYTTASGVYRRAGLQQELTEALANLGRLHLQLGDLGSAVSDYEQSREAARAIGYARGEVSALLELGAIERARKRYEQSQAYYREALRQARAKDLAGHVASAHAGLAAVALDRGDAGEGLREAQQALNNARPLGGLALIRAQVAMGEASLASKSHTAALTAFQEAAGHANRAGAVDLSWRAAFGQGRALEALNRGTEAIAAYRAAVNTIESVREELREERFRSGYLEDKYEVYVALVRLLLRQNLIGEAFLYSERLRARKHTEATAGRASSGMSQEELALRERIRRLRELLERENERPAPERRSDAAASYASELSKAEREYQNLLDSLRSQRPREATSRTLRLPTIEEMQAALPPEAALIGYLVGQDAASAFVLRRDALHAVTVEMNHAGLRSRVELLRELIQQPGDPSWQKPAQALHERLIAPLEENGWLTGARRIYVVPHGVLHSLPFNALMDRETGTPLAARYVIMNLPAAADLALPARQGAPADGTALVAAPARTRLRYAVEEARVVTGGFPGGVLLEGARATEQAFKRQAGRFDVIHVATHARLNPMNPMFSALDLEPGSGEDGRLMVHEILDLRLNARLVTLSACETAVGSGFFADAPAADDAVSLTRAFLRAGSQLVLASLWEVNDRSTLVFMRAFYQRLGGEGAVNALAGLQRAMIAGGGSHGHPYHWAAFVLTGREH